MWKYEKRFSALCWDMMYRATVVLDIKRAAVMVRTINLWCPCTSCAVHYESIVKNPTLNWDIITASNWVLAFFIHTVHNKINEKRQIKRYPWEVFEEDMHRRGMSPLKSEERVQIETLRDHLKKVYFGELPLIPPQEVRVRVLNCEKAATKMTAGDFTQMLSHIKPKGGNDVMFDNAIKNRWPLSMNLATRLEVSHMEQPDQSP